MGQRTIDTILRLQGESEYKSALKNCSAEMKVMKSELDKVTSDYRTNANSMEALTKKGEVLSKMYDAQKQKVELLRGAMAKAEETRDAEEKEVADLRGQYEKAQKALKAYGDELGETSEEYQKQKAEVDKLRDAVIQHQSKLDASTRSYQSYSVQLNKAEVDLNALQDKQRENNRLLAEAKQAADGCATSIDRYGDAARDAGDGTGKAASAVESMAGVMAASGIQQKVEDLAAAMMECSKASQAFEHAVAQVNTIADGSAMSPDAMKAGIMALSTDLRKDANEVADATYNALSAGVETAGVLDFVRQSSQLAIAGFTDMGTSVDVLTTILNAYGLEADQTEKVASTLVATQNLGKTTVDKLAGSMGKIIPSASAYNVNLNNIATAYANMTAKGLGTEEATTQLSAMMDELADSGSNVAAILQDRTGKTFTELMSDGASLGDVLDVLGASVEYDNTQFTNLWSSSTAAKAAVSLFDGSADAFNSTLTKMANSSGTVAKNFEKMTDTSEYSSQRLKVASSNLKIAIGDQLNPALDELREKGAGALEFATDFIRENPAVVSAITGVVTALGLLSTGLSALLMVKSVTAAMRALNIAMAANPAVIVATAIAGLVTALTVYNAQIESDKDKVDALTESARTLSETVSAGNASYEDAVVSSEAAYTTVQRYIERLKELEAQGLKTDAQQQEYAIILDKINSLMPGINAELDIQTGFVKGGTDALLEQAEAWKQNAIAEAAYARYKDDIAAMVDAEYELAKNQALLNIAIDDGKEINRKYDDTLKAIRENEEKRNILAPEVAKGNRAAIDATEKLQRKANDLVAELFDLKDQASENAKEQARLNAAIEESSQTIEENKVFVDAATDAYNSFSVQTTDTTEDVVVNIKTLSDEVEDASQRMQDAYDELYASAKDSLDKQIGLFSEVSEECDMSTADMIKNLKSQETAFNNYADNLQRAVEMGIDSRLIQQLSDGSVKSMQILAQLVNGTDEEIAKLNAAFDQSESAKENAAETMANLASTYSEEYQALYKEWVEKWTELGKAEADGLVKGWKSKERSVIDGGAHLAWAGYNGHKEFSMINSPSKKWQWLAEMEVAALLQVYRKAEPQMAEQAKNLSNAGYLGAIRAKQAAIPTMVSMVSTVSSGSDNSGVIQLLRQILSGVQAGQRLILYPDVLVGETVGRFDEALGQQKFLIDRGAR